jgi:LPXTG-site transpeptidase (sortase) family protein
MHTDPLYEYEQKLIHSLTRPSIVTLFWRGAKLLSVYLLLSGTIFSVLLGILNFSAYSARVLDWIDPDQLVALQDDLSSAIARSSITAHADAASTPVQAVAESSEVLTERVASIAPGLVYSRTYDPDRLLSTPDTESSARATFQVAPYENRIIIPKIGKNIPLVDVDHDIGASYTKMHEIFMEELKKGVVRYPGTARPGEVGNAFVFGHSSNYPWIKSEYNDIFALLDNLATGDEIIVFYDQVKYVYHVTDRATVKPGDVKTLESRDKTKKELSLMTCWPVGTTLERLIIFAELAE